MIDTMYTYLFIREDLTPAQKIVQAAHAAHNAGWKFGEHSHLICLRARDQNDLLKQAEYLAKKDIAHEIFHEPDNNTGFTAICTKPLIGLERSPLKRFSLLT